jgi:hypothetical protein
MGTKHSKSAAAPIAIGSRSSVLSAKRSLTRWMTARAPAGATKAPIHNTTATQARDGRW